MALDSKSVKVIDKHGALLVFPIQNRPEPKSLWSELYPKTQMRWEWDSSGDHKVADLWHLREELSRSKKVVYTKWYKGRATFFSREVFSTLYANLANELTLSRESKKVLEILLAESPLSTKELKKQCKLEGRFEEKTYNRALKDLWERLLIVGFGEVDDGAFPSLAVGATQVLFEELTKKMPKKEDDILLMRTLGEKNPFYLDFKKLSKKISARTDTKELKKKKTIRGKDLQLF